MGVCAALVSFDRSLFHNKFLTASKTTFSLSFSNTLIQFFLRCFHFLFNSCYVVKQRWIVSIFFINSCHANRFSYTKRQSYPRLRLHQTTDPYKPGWCLLVSSYNLLALCIKSWPTYPKLE